MQEIYKQKFTNRDNQTVPKSSDFILPDSLSDWINLLFLSVCMGFVVWTVEQTRWLNPSPSLITVIVISLLIGFLTARSRLPVVISLLIAVIAGAFVTFWQCLLITPGEDFNSRIAQLINDIRLFQEAQALGAPIPVTIHVSLIFLFLSWIIGYCSSWFLIRKRNPWPGVLLGTILQLVILNLWIGHFIYFLPFLAAALLLLVVANYTTNLSHLIKNGLGKSTRVLGLWVIIAMCLAVASLIFAWKNPGFGFKPVAEFASVNNPYRSTIDQKWQNFFAQLPGNTALSLIHGGQKDLTFGGSLATSEQVYFLIESSQQNYWKTQIFDYYDSTGWKTSLTTDTLTEPSQVNRETLASPDANNLNYIVIPQIKTDVLPFVGEFVSAGNQTIVKKLTPLVFEINLSESSKDYLLPDDLLSLAQSLRTARINSRRVTDSRLLSLIPDSLRVVKTEQSGARLQIIHVSRNVTESDNTMSISVSKPMDPLRQLDVAARMPANIQAGDLAQAGEIYPKEITDRYLQLPYTLPSRVKELAKSITERSATPYDKARAIKTYLAQYPYSLTIEKPSPNVDGVDYFLFSQKSGYCTYFASAMTVMLRSIGVPARMVTGFLTSQYQTDTGRAVIRDRDYHAWTEVYFPEYGWITLDATPGNVLSPLDQTTPNTVQNSQSGEIPVEPTPQDLLVPGVSTPENPGNNFNAFLVVSSATVVILVVLYILFTRKTRYGSDLYSPMIFLSRLGGFGPKPWQTSLEFAEQLSSVFPTQAPVIHRIISEYTIVCYGREKTFNQKDVDRQSWAKLKKALIKRIFHTG